MSKHTKEPWELVKNANNELFNGKSDECRWFIFEDCLQKDAQRIVACVNALAGIDNPEEWVENAKKAMEVQQ